MIWFTNYPVLLITPFSNGPEPIETESTMQPFIQLQQWCQSTKQAAEVHVSTKKQEYHSELLTIVIDISLLNPIRSTYSRTSECLKHTNHTRVLSPNSSEADPKVCLLPTEDEESQWPVSFEIIVRQSACCRLWCNKKHSFLYLQRLDPIQNPFQTLLFCFEYFERWKWGSLPLPNNFLESSHITADVKTFDVEYPLSPSLHQTNQLTSFVVHTPLTLLTSWRNAVSNSATCNSVAQPNQVFTGLHGANNKGANNFN